MQAKKIPRGSRTQSGANVASRTVANDPRDFRAILTTAAFLSFAAECGQTESWRAMFLFAETPQCYLQGVALEVMANPITFPRAGLTPKQVDIPELVANVKLEPARQRKLLTAPVKARRELDSIC